MNIENYLKYVQNNLGLKSVIIPQNTEFNLAFTTELSEAVNKIPDDSLILNQENEALPSMLNLTWENHTVDTGFVKAYFLRVYFEKDSMAETPMALELFLKLRTALGFSAQSAPLVEVSIAQWQLALEFLKQKTPRIILMIDDRIEKATADLDVWQIPDPIVLARQVELKRPTWELLKEWKNQK